METLSIFDIMPDIEWDKIPPINGRAMNILIACEESQRVCIAFREKGHNAFSCDIQECSGGHPEWHIKGDVLKILNPSQHWEDFKIWSGISFKTMDNTYHWFYGSWDLIIAHPPCTYMSKAGACRMYPKKGQIDPERFAKAMKAKNFFMNFYNADCERICIENPLPLKCVGLPTKTQTIQPYMFGDPYSKETLLWLKGLTMLKPTDICESWKPYLPSNTSRNAGTKYNEGTAHGTRKRSQTFTGIANAMAAQWG